MRTAALPMVVTTLCLSFAGCGGDSGDSAPAPAESAAPAAPAAADAEAVKKQAEADAAKMLAEAEAVKKQAEADAARVRAEAEAMKKKAEPAPPPAPKEPPPAAEPPPVAAAAPSKAEGPGEAKPAEAPAPAAAAPALEIGNSCEFTLQWQDKGSGGARDLAIHDPHVPAGFSSIGSYGQSDYKTPYGCVTVVKPLVDKLPNGKPALAAPTGYELVWTDKGSGADTDGSIWQPVSSDLDYACLGSVGQPGYNQPQIATYACVHKCLVRSVKAAAPMWSDKGTGADAPVTVFQLPNSKVIYATPGRGGSDALHDLDTAGTCQ